ncbi:MAG: S-ribosylhomocysteine lyase [Succinivibrio sp.]
MPLVDSFLVDHTIMPAPSVRLAKIMQTPHGDTIEVWDLRIKQPNKGTMPEKGIHTFEHYFAGFMREHLNEKGVVEVIDISPMGCKTGFYMSVIGKADPKKVCESFKASMNDIAAIPDGSTVPASNPLQCGSCDLHSLPEAKAIANEVLEKGITVTKSEDIALDPSRLKDLA